MGKNSNKRNWRKLLKKLQRKQKRQSAARQRDKQLEEDEMEKLKNPLYQLWLMEQESMERARQLAAEATRQQQQELWLRRELIAQQQFKKDALKRLAEEAHIEAENLKLSEELKLQEEARQKRREVLKLQAEKAAKEFDDLMACMQSYLEDPPLETPLRLNCSIESRTSEKSCDFFEKTNCCRYGLGCSFNHKRPLLAKIILIKHFFQHPLLEQQEHGEYAQSDSELELSESDLRETYDEFCEDVWPVLEEFGSIRNFRALRNVQPHLRGHVFVEYEEKRSALKAFINLQNRYYATKRLNVEFSNIRQWRTGVCGMRSFLEGLSLTRKCPKGVKCNFLHLLGNKHNKYSMPIETPERSTPKGVLSTKELRQTPLISWNTIDRHTNQANQSRNWRWSESPEVEIRNNVDDFRGDNNEVHSRNSETPRTLPRMHQSNSLRFTSRSKSPNIYQPRNEETLNLKSPNTSHYKNRKCLYNSRINRKSGTRSSSSKHNKY